MYLSSSDKEMLLEIVQNNRASAQAAAYTIYMQIKPSGKNILTPREFQKEFEDNWETFMKIEKEVCLEE